MYFTFILILIVTFIGLDRVNVHVTLVGSIFLVSQTSVQKQLALHHVEDIESSKAVSYLHYYNDYYNF